MKIILKKVPCSVARPRIVYIREYPPPPGLITPTQTVICFSTSTQSGLRRPPSKTSRFNRVINARYWIMHDSSLSLATGEFINANTKRISVFMLDRRLLNIALTTFSPIRLIGILENKRGFIVDHWLQINSYGQTQNVPFLFTYEDQMGSFR